MKALLSILILLTTLTSAYSQFIPKQDVYDLNEGDKKYWEKIYKFPITLDTARYYNGDIIYTKSSLNGAIAFKKYNAGGKLHILGKNIELRQKNNKTIPFSGNWTIYHYNQQKKKEIIFENGRKLELRTYNESGELSKDKKINQKFTYGFQIGYEQSILNIKSEGDTLLISGSSTGFNLGFLIEYNLSEKLDLRSLITESFQEYTLQFESNGVLEDAKVDYAIFRLPLTMVYRLTENLEILNGFSANFSITDDAFDDIILGTKWFDLSLDTGISYEFRFKNFIAAPEFRYSPQLTNWVKSTTAIYSRSVNRLNRSDFSFSIIFKSIPNNRS